MKYADYVVVKNMVIGKTGKFAIDIQSYDTKQFSCGHGVAIYDTAEEYEVFNPSFDDAIKTEINKMEQEGDSGFLQDREGREAYYDNLYRILAGSMEARFEIEKEKVREQLLQNTSEQTEADMQDFYMLRRVRPYTTSDELPAVEAIFTSERVAKAVEKELNKYYKPDDKDRFYIQAVRELASAPSLRGE